MGYTQDDAVAHAADRANRDRGACFSVYLDDNGTYYVRASEAVRPASVKLICIAQYWGDETVQVRYDGARSEWRRF